LVIEYIGPVWRSSVRMEIWAWSPTTQEHYFYVASTSTSLFVVITRLDFGLK